MSGGTPSRYAQVATLAAHALTTTSGSITRISLRQSGGSLEHAKGVARSLQMTFSAWRNDKRKTTRRQTGNPLATLDVDNLASRVLPAPDGDGYFFELFPVSSTVIEFEVMDRESGKVVNVFEELAKAASATGRPTYRMIQQHPLFAEAMEIGEKEVGDRTAEEKALLAQILADIQPEGKAERTEHVPGLAPTLTEFERAQEAIAEEKDARLAAELEEVNLAKREAKRLAVLQQAEEFKAKQEAEGGESQAELWRKHREADEAQIKAGAIFAPTDTKST